VFTLLQVFMSILTIIIIFVCFSYSSVVLMYTTVYLMTIQTWYVYVIVEWVLFMCFCTSLKIMPLLGYSKGPCTLVGLLRHKSECDS